MSKVADASGCIDFRQAIGAEPKRRDPALSRHRLECRSCNQYALGIEQLDRALSLALAVPVPEGLAHRVVLRAGSGPRWPRFGLALAAGVALLAIGVALGARWARGPASFDPATLANDVMAHAHHEPESWTPMLQPVALARLRGVLERSEIELLDQARLGPVSYATTCRFRGRDVPHLTVQSVAGPAMVLLLPQQRLAQELPLAEDGLRGVIVPVGAGSIAIVAADPAAVAAVRQRLTSAVRIGI
jgi:hypothetical protein